MLESLFNKVDIQLLAKILFLKISQSSQRSICVGVICQKLVSKTCIQNEIIEIQIIKIQILFLIKQENAMRRINRDDFLQLGFTLKISLFSEG